MLKQNPEFAQSVLLNQVQSVYTNLLTAYPNNGLKEQLTTGTRYNGNGKVEAFLSFNPNSRKDARTIDVTFALACRESRAVFSSEIAWSDGKVIDEVVVCDMCPECMEELGERVESIASKNQTALVNRMVDLLENFQHH